MVSSNQKQKLSTLPKGTRKQGFCLLLSQLGSQHANETGLLIEQEGKNCLRHRQKKIITKPVWDMFELGNFFPLVRLLYPFPEYKQAIVWVPRLRGMFYFFSVSLIELNSSLLHRRQKRWWHPPRQGVAKPFASGRNRSYVHHPELQLWITWEE